MLAGLQSDLGHHLSLRVADEAVAHMYEKCQRLPFARLRDGLASHQPPAFCPDDGGGWALPVTHGHGYPIISFGQRYAEIKRGIRCDEIPFHGISAAFNGYRL